MRKPAKPLDRRTNTEVVIDLMEFSDYGALAQLIVIDALTKWSEKIRKSDPADYPRGGLVNPEAWIGVAVEINDKLNERYDQAINKV